MYQQIKSELESLSLNVTMWPGEEKIDGTVFASTLDQALLVEAAISRYSEVCRDAYFWPKEIQGDLFEITFLLYP